MTREEAIEVYHGLINTKIKEAFEFFAPELAESEDEKIMQTMIKDGDLKPSEIAWLKSLRPHWKPSEEQMKALKECGGCKRAIESLYNDFQTKL